MRKKRCLTLILTAFCCNLLLRWAVKNGDDEKELKGETKDGIFRTKSSSLHSASNRSIGTAKKLPSLPRSSSAASHQGNQTILLPPSPSVLISPAHQTNKERGRNGVGEGMTTPSSSAKRILILSSNPRSGSSLLADLISSLPKSVYFFEPLRYLGIYSKMASGDEIIQRSKRNEIIDPRLPFKFLDFFATCRLPSRIFRYLFYNRKARGFIFRKPGFKKIGKGYVRMNLGMQQVHKECVEADHNVIKLIRMRLEDFKNDFSPFTHVIYLVRDPRAVLNSLRKPIAKNEFNPEFREVRTVCDKIERDLDVFEDSSLRQEQPTVTMVRYEDLVDDPMTVGLRLFSFLNVSGDTSGLITAFWKDHLKSGMEISSPTSNGQNDSSSAMDGRRHLHLAANEDDDFLEETTTEEGEDSSHKNPDTSLKKYYGTVRDPAFDPYHWIKEMDRKFLAVIEAHPKCQQVIRRMNYKFVTQ